MTGDTPPRPVTWLPLLAVLVPLLLAALAFGAQTYGDLQYVRWRLAEHENAPWHIEASRRYSRIDEDLAALRERLGRLEERLRQCEEQRKR